jgi:FkbM family methyltransferase
MISIIRKILPRKLQILIGRMANKSIERFPVLVFPFNYIRDGIYMKPYENKFLISHNGLEIIIGFDWLVFNEIFHEQVYDKFFTVEPGDVVIDVGAHVGVFTLKAARATSEQGRVVAIEPEPTNLNLLRQNILNNGFSNITVVDKACTSHRGKVKLYLAPLSCGASLVNPLLVSSGKHIEVQADTLDDILSDLALSRVNFIKIDAEGSELEILKGAEKTLMYPGLKLSIASYHTLADGTPEFSPIQSFLEQRGFSICANKDPLHIHDFIYAIRGRGKQQS